MSPVLLPIYGPLAVHAYGLCIAIGGLIAFYLLYHDKKATSLISESTLVTAFQLMLLSGYLGGRIVLMISEPSSMADPFFLFKFWEPGLSILGTIIGITITITTYFYMKHIPLLPFLDRVSLYGPIVQGFGRLGCFFAGCCYGLPTKAWYAVTYTNPAHMAPLHCSLHPAQLYSSIILLAIFLFLYFVQQHRTKYAGELFLSYIILVSAERFLIDFVRWDRVFTLTPSFLQLFSIHQWIALVMYCGAMLGIFIIHKLKQ